MQISPYGTPSWMNWQGNDVMQAPLSGGSGGIFGGGHAQMFGQPQQQGGYDSSGINPNGMFTGGNLFGGHPNVSMMPDAFPASPVANPQRPAGFNPMPMAGNMGQSMGGFGSPIGQKGSGSYDSSGINPGGMFGQQRFGMGPLFGGGTYGTPYGSSYGAR
jgi:hypothetical protein